jgi:transcriptional regulator with PAS, ATPase and Fis domain
VNHLLQPEEIVGYSANLRFVQQRLDRAAPSEAAILITGETGTGKELFARRAHRLSNRSGRPLVCINCSALPDHLLESELFGFEKGAFTGAISRHEGLFLQAHRGTIFLDEIGDLSLTAQAKLLRILEEREVRLLGSRAPLPLDFRLLAATNRDLAQLVAENRFREDLFFRVDVIQVRIPPLRERQDDIPVLADHFLSLLSLQHHRPLIRLSSDASAYLKRHPWIGNIRELRNVIERVFWFSNSEYITVQDIAPMSHVTTCWKTSGATESPPTFHVSPASHAPYRTSRSEFRQHSVRSSHISEPELLRKTLEETKWNKTKAAKLLRCSRMTIHRKVVQYQLMRLVP